MKTKAFLILAALLVMIGCGAKKQMIKPEPVVQVQPEKQAQRYEPVQAWPEKTAILEALSQAQKDNARRAEEAMLEKLKPKPKANVEISSLEILAENWNAGIIHKSLQELKLRFTLKESNGIGLELDKYYLTVTCTYKGLSRTSQASQTGTFFFKEPVKLKALEKKEVFIDTNTWASRTAQAMNKALKLEKYSIRITLTGQDDFQNQVTVESENTPI
jgi:hypothetical protein